MTAPPGPPETIRCVECGGTCHRISYVPEEGFEPGDVVAYRCADCAERFDVEVSADDFEAPGDPW